MARHFPHFDSANHHAADTAANIDRSYKILTEFRMWATRELSVMRWVTGQTQIAIDDSRTVLAGFPAMPCTTDSDAAQLNPPSGIGNIVRTWAPPGNRNGLRCLAM